MAQTVEGIAAPADGSLEESVLIGADSRTFHAYLHIPFCRVRCGYCDFNTYTASELTDVSQSTFAATIIREIEFAARVIETRGLPKRQLATVFFGGGTPTQLPASDLVSILAALESAFGIAPGAEITTEANPDSVDASFLLELATGGFTRVSFGMQSAVPHVLKVLDRTHNVENLPLVVAAAKAAGLATSVDLIYGAPTESLEDFRLSLAAAIALNPDHISAYSLIVEPGTKLARQIKVGELPEPDEDEQADKYLMADSMLADAGFDWYEISNWAKSEAQRSKHNLAYWQSQDWWGFGPGAHSHIGGTRWWNVKHPSAYAGKLQANASPTQARELLDEKTQAVEKVLLEMRIRAGISIDRIKMASDQPERVAGVVADAIARDLIEAKAAIGGQLVLTLPGRLIADALLRELLG